VKNEGCFPRRKINGKLTLTEANGMSEQYQIKIHWVQEKELLRYISECQNAK
jgi:hypothetical protein